MIKQAKQLQNSPRNFKNSEKRPKYRKTIKTLKNLKKRRNHRKTVKNEQKPLKIFKKRK